MNSDDRLRWYLEQMMVRFTSLDIPVGRAAMELVEIEAHSTASGADPFVEFGDPQKLATSLLPPDELAAAYRKNLHRDLITGVLFGGTLFAFVQFLLSCFGYDERSVPKMIIYFALVLIFCVGQVAFSSVLMGVSDEEASFRLRGIPKACLAGLAGLTMMVSLLGIAGADFSTGLRLQVSSEGWLITTFLIGAGLVLAFWRLHRTTRDSYPVVEGGITGQILHEIHHNGFGVGWVRFGIDGTDLRDPNWSIGAELRKVRSAVKD